MILATKVHGWLGDDPNHAGKSRRWIIREVEDSLRRLQTDHIDLYQVHRPETARRSTRPWRAHRPGAPGQDPLLRHVDLPARQIVEANGSRRSGRASAL